MARTEDYDGNISTFTPSALAIQMESSSKVVGYEQATLEIIVDP